MVKKSKYKPRLLELYEKKIVSAMMKKFGYKNKMQVPKLSKITVNIGVGRAKEEPTLLKKAQEDLRVITGQQPIITKSKRAISNFKVRAGDPVGCLVTLRRYRMYEFLDRLINIAIPRVRDFRGLPDRSLDGRGNFNMGLKEQIVFPEIDYDKIEKIRGLNITIVTSAATDEEGVALLKGFGLPFAKRAVEEV